MDIIRNYHTFLCRRHLFYDKRNMNKQQTDEYMALDIKISDAEDNIKKNSNEIWKLKNNNLSLSHGITNMKKRKYQLIGRVWIEKNGR